MTADPWAAVSAARLPGPGLAALAPVRDRDDVRVYVDDEGAWVVWPAGRADVARCLLPVMGVEFYARRGDGWARLGSRLPSIGPPAGDGRPVAAVLFPARFEPTPPGGGPGSPAPLRVVRGGEPRPATVLACRVADLLGWADRATTAELAAVRVARSGPRAVLLGATLPTVPGATRYWGDAVRMPVGFRADPDLSPDLLRAAVGATAGEVVLLDAGGAEVIPGTAFEPPTRAGLRLAAS